MKNVIIFLIIFLSFLMEEQITNARPQPKSKRNSYLMVKSNDHKNLRKYKKGSGFYDRHYCVYGNKRKG